MTDLTILDDSNPGLQRWAGSVIKAPDGIYLFIYERFTVVGTGAGTGEPGIFVREGPGPFGPWGQERRLNPNDKVGGYDPTFFRTPNGKVYATWSGEKSCWYAERLAPDSYGPAMVLWTAAANEGLSETQGFVVAGKAYITYCHRTDPTAPFDAKIRTVGDGGDGGLKLGAETLIAPAAVGSGNQGHQNRITLVNDGQGGLIAAWNGLPNAAGERPITFSLSSDGVKWSKPDATAVYPGHDLVEPTGVKVSSSDVRLYFAQDRALPGFGYAQTTDHGSTWARHDVTNAPVGAGTTHVYVFKAGTQLVCFCQETVSGKPGQKLGTYLLESV